MVTTYKRMPIPPLVINMPSCPICDKSVEHDGEVYVCRECSCTWDRADDSTPGEADVEFPQCNAEDMPYADGEYPNLANYKFRCVKNLDHPLERWRHQHVGVRVDRKDVLYGTLHEWV